MTLQQEAPPVGRERVPARARRGPNRTWRLLQKLHRWASLVTGIVLLLIILSGAVLVLGPEIDEWTHPDLYRSTPSERPISPEQAVAVVRRELPDFAPADVVRNRGVYEVWTPSTRTLRTWIPAAASSSASATRSPASWASSATCTCAR